MKQKQTPFLHFYESFTVVHNFTAMGGASTYLVKHRTTKKLSVVKFYSKRVEVAKKELKTLVELSSSRSAFLRDHVPKLLEFGYTDSPDPFSSPGVEGAYSTFYFPQEFIKGETLASFIANSREHASSESVVDAILFQVIKALKAMKDYHQLNHNDLHTKNVVISTKTFKRGKVVAPKVYLIDFGWTAERNDWYRIPIFDKSYRSEMTWKEKLRSFAHSSVQFLHGDTSDVMMIDAIEMLLHRNMPREWQVCHSLEGCLSEVDHYDF